MSFSRCKDFISSRVWFKNVILSVHRGISVDVICRFVGLNIPFCGLETSSCGCNNVLLWKTIFGMSNFVIFLVLKKLFYRSKYVLFYPYGEVFFGSKNVIVCMGPKTCLV